MPIWHAIWRDAFVRASFIATVLTASPAIAASCPLLSVEDLAEKLPAADRFEFETGMLRPFLALWAQHHDAPLAAPPDGVALFAFRGRPLLIAFRRAGCLVALLPAEPAELWQALREHIGPIA
ncbi:hypothetical protein [Benzoatithermus flavus]|uniref:Uncharacterized protein n=1 Tax=Benzoatithermus flavus TaxID=3108223 RepID=A0ABU8XKL2_9PROT